MKESDVGIEKESTPFVSIHNLSNTKTLEIEYALAGSIFKTQLQIFREVTPKEFLHILYEFSIRVIKNSKVV